MSPDVERVGALLREVAAAEAMPRFRALGEGDIMEKRAGDLVTVADLAVERALTRRLPDLLPGSLVVGEEAVEADPAVLDRLSGQETLWIVDPIDGTGNFARGHPVFALIVALVRGPELLAGWILDPVGGRLAVAERGSGARLDGRLMTVRQGRPLAALRGTLHAGTLGPKDMAKRLEQRRRRVTTLKSLRCAGHEYLRLLEGGSDFTLFSRTKPWDHCAGVLLHAEAGGIGRLIDRKPYTAKDHSAPGLLMAPDEAAWDEIHDTLLAGD